MPSLLKFAREKQRQRRTGDTQFYRAPLYFFELEVPAQVSRKGVATRYLFPLVLNPEAYSLSEPFSVELTPTQGGGLYAEENGIVQRSIMLEGTTGFKPRTLTRVPFTANEVLKPEQTSFSRTLPNYILDQLSGQRHFQYLQDAVFRTYADLKRDPATSEGTRLYFHNPKDSEDWLVVPQKFDLSRSAGDRTRIIYQYSIELAVVDKADAVDISFSEDKSLLDQLKALIATIKRAADIIAGAVNDLTALVGELSNIIKSIASIIDTVTSILTAVNDFIDGVTELIETPFAILESVNGLIEEALEIRSNAEEFEQAVMDFPDTARQKLRQIQDGMELLSTHPEAFETTSQQKMRSIKEKQDLRRAISTAARTAASESTPPQTLSEMAAAGTKVLPGEAQAAEGTAEAGSGVLEYTSTRTVNVAQGDTLVNLAAQYLGDARLWQHIAVVNGLKPPYIADQASADLLSDESPFPRTLGIGQQILIPSFAKPPQERPLLPVLGVTSNASVEEHLLGTDVQIDRVGGRDGAPLYDLKVDTNRGASDVKKAVGSDCLAQGIFLRVTIERGTDILYKRLGVQRIVGLNNSDIDLETARFRFYQSIVVDPRVAALRNIEFEESTDDALIIDAIVEIKGLATNSNIRITT